MNLVSRKLRQGLELFHSDSLFRNAVYLMSSTAIMAVLGLGFWLFVSRLYTPQEIGLASALIAITIFNASMSFFGLNAGIMRFLPGSQNRSGDINAAMVAVSIASMLGAMAYLFWVGDDFSSYLAFFNSGLAGRLSFVVIMALVSLNTFTDSVFIASRRAEFHTIVYACFGLVKLILPLILVPLGSLGIFTAYAAAVFVSLILSLVFMSRYCGYRPFTRPNWGFIRHSGKYASNNYAASLLSGLPAQIMPSVILARLGSADAAFFSLSWTMAALLYVAPMAITKSLLAEGSHDLSKRRGNLRSAVKLLATILIPAVTIAVLLAPQVLRLFGRQYADGSTILFQLLAICAFCIAANSIGDTIMNLEHRSRGIVLVQIVITVVMFSLTFAFTRFGLLGVGVAILIGYLCGNVTQALLLLKQNAQRVKLNSLPLLKKPAPSSTVIQRFLDLYHLNDAEVGADIGGGDRCSTVVVTSGKQKYVLKVFNIHKRTAEQISEEISFMQYLYEHGIPAPKVRTNAYNQLISEQTIDGVTWVGMIMDFETGKQPTSYTPELLADMAKLQGRIHLQGAEYAKQIGDRLKIVRGRSYLSLLLTFMPRGLSHFDYYSNNILARGNKVSCTLDFEGMRYDPLVVCVTFTLIRFYSDFRNPSELERYLRAYQTVRPLSQMEKRLLRLGLALRFLSPKLLRLSV